MGISIIEEPQYGYKAMYNDTTMQAFGPVMYAEDDVEAFLAWIDVEDPSEMSKEELDWKVSEWRKDRPVQESYIQMFKEAKEIVESTTPHFVIFTGDEIVDSAHDIKQAEHVYAGIEPGIRPSQSVALYSLIKEKRIKR